MHVASHNSTKILATLLKEYLIAHDDDYNDVFEVFEGANTRVNYVVISQTHIDSEGYESIDGMAITIYFHEDKIILADDSLGSQILSYFLSDQEILSRIGEVLKRHDSE